MPVWGLDKALFDPPLKLRDEVLVVVGLVLRISNELLAFFYINFDCFNRVFCDELVVSGLSIFVLRRLR
jgi:hypothetical protein